MKISNCEAGSCNGGGGGVGGGGIAMLLTVSDNIIIGSLNFDHRYGVDK